MNCCCETIGSALDVPRQCPEHFSLWRGDRRLISVGKIVAMWPQEPCSGCGMPIYSNHIGACPVKANIDNAKERGSEADNLFGRYVMGKLHAIPAGTREDVANKNGTGLLQKLIRWFDAQKFSSVESQVVVADEEVGGVLDLRADGMILDLKCTYDVSPTHKIQVGGYVALDKTVKKAAVLHCTERFAAPRLLYLDVAEIVSDFTTCRKMWQLVNRKK
jgi:hypothetical protein